MTHIGYAMQEKLLGNVQLHSYYISTIMVKTLSNMFVLNETYFDKKNKKI